MASDPDQQPGARPAPDSRDLIPGPGADRRGLLERARRWLLFLWIRPTILGADYNALRLDRSVCYALANESVTDLAIVDEACIRNGLPRPYRGIAGTPERRSFFFLNRPEGFWGRRSARHTSSRMQRLLETARDGQPVDVVPVSLFWGHQPDREQSMFRTLFSETWSATSKLRKLMALLFYPNHILVQFSRPIRLIELIASESDVRLQERKLQRLLRTHNTRQKRAILGPDLSHRRTLINTIVTSTAVREAIIAATGNDEVSADAAVTKARAYASEIVSHQTYQVVRFFNVLLTWLWNRLYDGIDVHRIGQVKKLAEANEIVYVPCHRSHIDYLLLSYVLYHNGLTPPHIAAGRNLNLPVVGPLLRRAGAFFMRRSFQGDSLYRAVFDEYIHLMFVKGHSVEYFIEGGRSRTGRMLHPKAGMLNMTIRSLQRSADLPIKLQPVYIGYERIIEGATYLGELRGRAKKDESVLDIVRATRALKGPYGRVTVSFGEALDLAQFLDGTMPAWRTADDSTRARLPNASEELANKLTTRINAAVSINPVNLLATALLSAPRQTMEADQLLYQLQLLAALAGRTRLDGHATVTKLSPSEVLSHAADVVGLAPRLHDFGELWRATDEESILLTYYRNNTVHAFVMPALTARLVAKGPTSVSAVSALFETLKAFIETECFLQLGETLVLAERCLLALAELELIHSNGQEYRAAPVASRNYVALLNISQVVIPTLERFHIVNTLIAAAADGAASAKLGDLESTAAAIARRLSAIYGLNSPSFFDQNLFAAFLSTLRRLGLVNVTAGKVDPNANHEAFATTIADLLDDDVRFQVAQAVVQAGTDAPIELSD